MTSPVDLEAFKANALKLNREYEEKQRRTSQRVLDHYRQVYGIGTVK